MKSKILLVSGFLGSGKTSFLRHWLENLKPAGESAALVVNEIGATNWDALLLERFGLDTLKLLSGCLCCSQKEELFRGLKRLLEKPAGGRAGVSMNSGTGPAGPVPAAQPDWVLVESSGLAEPAETLDTLLHPAFRPLASLAAAVTVVDAGRLHRRASRGSPAAGSRATELMDKQASYASLLLANKADLVPAASRPGVETALRAANPRARLEWTLDGRLDGAAWRAELEAPLLLKPGAENSPGVLSFDGYYSWEYFPASAFQPGRLLESLRRLPAGVERVKGLARLEDGSWVLVQVAAGQARLHPWTEEPDLKPQLTFIGRDLDGGKLESILKEALGQGFGPGPRPG